MDRVESKLKVPKDKYVGPESPKSPKITTPKPSYLQILTSNKPENTQVLKTSTPAQLLTGLSEGKASDSLTDSLKLNFLTNQDPNFNQNLKTNPKKLDDKNTSLKKQMPFQKKTDVSFPKALPTLSPNNKFEKLEPTSYCNSQPTSEGSSRVAFLPSKWSSPHINPFKGPSLKKTQAKDECIKTLSSTRQLQHGSETPLRLGTKNYPLRGPHAQPQENQEKNSLEIPSSSNADRADVINKSEANVGSDDSRNAHTKDQPTWRKKTDFPKLQSVFDTAQPISISETRPKVDLSSLGKLNTPEIYNLQGSSRKKTETKDGWVTVLGSRRKPQNEFDKPIGSKNTNSLSRTSIALDLENKKQNSSKIYLSIKSQSRDQTSKREAEFGSAESFQAATKDLPTISPKTSIEKARDQDGLIVVSGTRRKLQHDPEMPIGFGAVENPLQTSAELSSNIKMQKSSEIASNINTDDVNEIKNYKSELGSDESSEPLVSKFPDPAEKILASDKVDDPSKQNSKQSQKQESWASKHRKSKNKSTRLGSRNSGQPPNQSDTLKHQEKLANEVYPPSLERSIFHETDTQLAASQRKSKEANENSSTNAVSHSQTIEFPWVTNSVGNHAMKMIPINSLPQLPQKLVTISPHEKNQDLDFLKRLKLAQLEREFQKAFSPWTNNKQEKGSEIWKVIHTHYESFRNGKEKQRQDVKALVESFAIHLEVSNKNTNVPIKPLNEELFETLKETWNIQQADFLKSFELILSKFPDIHEGFRRAYLFSQQIFQQNIVSGWEHIKNVLLEREKLSKADVELMETLFQPFTPFPDLLTPLSRLEKDDLNIKLKRMNSKTKIVLSKLMGDKEFESRQSIMTYLRSAKNLPNWWQKSELTQSVRALGLQPAIILQIIEALRLDSKQPLVATKLSKQEVSRKFGIVETAIHQIQHKGFLKWYASPERAWLISKFPSEYQLQINQLCIAHRFRNKDEQEVTRVVRDSDAESLSDQRLLMNLHPADFLIWMDNGISNGTIARVFLASLDMKLFSKDDWMALIESLDLGLDSNQVEVVASWFIAYRVKS
ncbi:hypothetical protein O181_002800 [Austropuccinia psidii MF-1]|uniref:Uncharacterized protein n=1 Tax=Austropuccinia psidii MF-1 TaxID=1389203 RepID=A0A9Q3BD57_9BASI|nr:hypothetical protein [Austropuccinia psidii MF-1]